MRWIFTGCIVLTFISTSILAEERIRSFHSDITVDENGDMRVIETITVNAEGNKIKRGIYRDIPTKYEDRFGNNYSVGFSVESVMRDGNLEHFRTENKSNGVRIYIGNKNQRIKSGIYTYTISYRTNRQLGFFDHHDELYWNVSGNEWDFPIIVFGICLYQRDRFIINCSRLIIRQQWRRWLVAISKLCLDAAWISHRSPICYS